MFRPLLGILVIMAFAGGIFWLFTAGLPQAAKEEMNVTGGLRSLASDLWLKGTAPEIRLEDPDLTTELARLRKKVGLSPSIIVIEAENRAGQPVASHELIYLLGQRQVLAIRVFLDRTEGKVDLLTFRPARNSPPRNLCPDRICRRTHPSGLWKNTRTARKREQDQPASPRLMTAICSLLPTIPMSSMLPHAPRRDVLKAGVAGCAALAFPSITLGAPDSRRLKVGLIGCGGRGTGAAQDAMNADSNVELHAVGDVFPESIATSLRSLKQAFKDRVTVDESRTFVGMDAYQKVLASGVDVVLLATPPGFRPMHFEAAVAAGKHIFCEKPMGVDIPGVKRIMAAAEKAKAQGTAVVGGFCWRRSASRRAAFEQIANGAIGDITSYYATYYTGPVKPMQPASARQAGWSDIEWQLRNWMNFSWLSGDSFVEQAVHSVDKVGWAFQDKSPLTCIATGGRQVPAEGGNIYDHFSAIYEYPDGVFAHVASRQQTKCDNENADYIRGTKGLCIIGRGANPVIKGETNWRYREEDNQMYTQEHIELFQSIRAGAPINDGSWMCHSTMLGIMGRMAAYTGKRVTWDQVMNSKDDLAPEDTFQWDSSFTPTPLPQPGVTQLT